MGFIHICKIQNDEQTNCMKSILRLLIVGLCMIPLLGISQPARVQFIHNAPDTSLKYVDIYWNNTLLYNNFVFHRASPFINRTADAMAVISIADSSSTSVDDAIYSMEIVPAASAKYLLILEGISVMDGYESYAPLNIKIVENAREEGLEYSTVDMLFVNGSPDAGVYTIEETSLLQIPFTSGLSYGENDEYTSIFSADFIFQITDSATHQSLGEFSAPLSQYGLSGKAVTILTSGFSNPSANSDGALLSMWMARAEGGMMIEFSSTVTHIQIAHNSSDVALQEVDVYWNGQRIFEHLKFRHSSKLVTRRHTNAGVTLGIAPAGSASASEIFYTQTFQPVSMDTSSFVLSGMQSPTGYSHYSPLVLLPYDHSDWNGTSNQLEVKLFHGISDLEGFRVVNAFSDELVSAIDYEQWLTFETTHGAQQWRMRNVSSSYEIGRWIVPEVWASLSGLRVVSNGFANPSQNNQGANIGLWIIAGPGQPFIPLEQVPITPVAMRVLNNSSDSGITTADFYLNGKLLASNLMLNEAQEVLIPTGVDVELAVVPAGAGWQNHRLLQTLQFETGLSNLLILDGISNAAQYNPAPALAFHILANPMSNSGSSQETAFMFYNGTTDMGQLTISSPGTGINWFESVGFGLFGSDYMASTEPNELILRVSHASGNFIFNHYRLPIADSALAGEAIILFTHGFWNPANNNQGPGFGLWMLRSDGTTQPLQTVNYVEVETLLGESDLTVFPNPADHEIMLRQHNHLVDDHRHFQIWDTYGRNVLEGPVQGAIEIYRLAPGVYVLKSGGMQARFIVR